MNSLHGLRGSYHLNDSLDRLLAQMRARVCSKPCECCAELREAIARAEAVADGEPA